MIMLPIERRNEILQRLITNGKVVVAELSEQYDVTEETIRRDLEKLEAEGYAKKIYGGAVLNDDINTDLPHVIRKQTNVSGKKYIANIIGGLIKDGDKIILDSSTTAMFTVRSIFDKRKITLVTNSLEVLLELPRENDWNVIATGGDYMADCMCFTGSRAEEHIESYYADYAILSCKGIDKERGMTDTREPFVRMKKIFLRSAKKVILAVDHTKFDVVSFSRFGELDDIDIVVTDVEPDALWKKIFIEKGIELYY